MSSAITYVNIMCVYSTYRMLKNTPTTRLKENLVIDTLTVMTTLSKTYRHSNTLI